MFFLSVLAMLAPLQISSLSFLPGVAVSWGIYFCILMGFFSTRRIRFKSNKQHQESRKLCNSGGYMVLLVGCSFLFSQYAMHFYTGQTLLTMIKHLSSGESLYALYQAYFADKELMVLSLTKVPAIISMILLKLSVLWAFYAYCYLPSKITSIQKVVLALVSINFMSFSVARGTNFELFELLFIFMASLLFRVKFKGMIISVRFLAIIALLIFLVGNIYVFTISSRFGDAGIYMCSSESICLNTDSIFYKILPGLAVFLYLLSGYFVFGLLYISTFIDFFLYDQGWSSFLSFFPLGYHLNGIDITRVAICDVYLDCGASWTPSVIRWISIFGLVILLMLLMLLGWIGRVIEDNHQGDFLSFMLVIYVALLIISLPVGNFLFVSSANAVLFTFGLFIFFFKNIKVRSL